MPTAPAPTKFDYKDVLAIAGLGLLGWGLLRLGGLTCLILFSGIVLLAFSGLLHLAVTYAIGIIRSLRAEKKAI